MCGGHLSDASSWFRARAGARPFLCPEAQPRVPRTVGRSPGRNPSLQRGHPGSGPVCGRDFSSVKAEGASSAWALAWQELHQVRARHPVDAAKDARNE